MLLGPGRPGRHDRTASTPCTASVLGDQFGDHCDQDDHDEEDDNEQETTRRPPGDHRDNTKRTRRDNQETTRRPTRTAPKYFAPSTGALRTTHGTFALSTEGHPESVSPNTAAMKSGACGVIHNESRPRPSANSGTPAKTMLRTTAPLQSPRILCT